MSKLNTLSENYLNSSEGLSSIKGSKYYALKEFVENVTIGEIITQYNIHSVNKTWTDALGEIYTEELLERILSDATFSMIIVYRSIKEWLEHPYVSLQLGFESGYPILDAEKEQVFLNDPIAKYFVLNNDEFPEEVQRDLIRKFLLDKINVTVEIVGDNLYVSKIGDFSVAVVSATNYVVPLTVYNVPDLHLLYIIMNNIWTKNYEIIDLYSRYEDEFIDEQIEVVSLPEADELVEKYQTNLSGLWKKIHITALRCNDIDKFADWIWEVCKNMPCDCKWHALIYIQKHPPSDLVPTSSESDVNIAFYWSWQFHNEVNKRLDKPLYPYETALEYYSNLI
jgi:hypothetical protein